MKLGRNAIYSLSSISITALALYYILYDISLVDIFQLIKEADRTFVSFFVILSLLGVFFRAMRYQILLAASGYLVRTDVMYLVVLVRNICVDLLPARLGSLVYVAVITTKLKVPMPAALASWAHEILFDLIALAPLVFAAALAVSNGAYLNRGTLVSLASILIVMFILILKTLPYILNIMAKIIEPRTIESVTKEDAVSSTSPLNVRHRMAKIIREFRTEVLRCRSSGIYGQVIVLSILIRLSKYVALYLFLLALLMPRGYTSTTLPLPIVFFGLLSAELTATLPISGIAGIGAYQGMWIVVFTLLGLAPDIAKLTSISHHLFTQVYAYSLGICAALLLTLPWIKYSEHRPTLKKASNNKFTRTICLALFFAAFAGFSSNQLLAQTSTTSPSSLVSHTLSAEPLDVLRELKLDLVFDSNRSGTFGIYRTDYQKQTISVIRDTLNHEMFPDSATDGSAIVYAEAISLQRESPSKVYMLSMNTSEIAREPQLITDNGTFPTFSQDGHTIYFERDRHSVWAYDIEKSREHQLFPFRDQTFTGEVVKPRISADNIYLFFTSDKPKRWSTWRVNLKDRSQEFIAPGCEALPSPIIPEMTWVRTINVKEGSGIYSTLSSTTAPGNVTIREVLDQGAPRGHEYFPSYACHGSLLLWSASSPGQHSHESADYQVFMREESSRRITQITTDTYTNRWPKVLSCP